MRESEWVFEGEVVREARGEMRIKKPISRLIISTNSDHEYSQYNSFV